jgi:hypothetical protein
MQTTWFTETWWVLLSSFCCTSICVLARLCGLSVAPPPACMDTSPLAVCTVGDCLCMCCLCVQNARNVLVSSCSRSEIGMSAKVADLGLARCLAHHATHRTTNSCGTMSHMAPELLRYGRLSPAVDLYAFGVMSKCCKSCAHSLNCHNRCMPCKVCSRLLSLHVIVVCRASMGVCGCALKWFISL